MTQDYRVFRARRGRRMAQIMAVAVMAIFVVMAVAVSLQQGVNWDVTDQLSAIVMGLIMAAGVLRVGNVQAVPDERGLTIRNVVYTTQLEWAQIVNVRFGGAEPWVTLDVSDGEAMSVMAIQRADGEFGRAEAKRLANLVAAHTATSGD